MSSGNLSRLISVLQTASDSGLVLQIKEKENETHVEETSNPLWSSANSIFFATTVITTVGKAMVHLKILFHYHREIVHKK